MLYPYPLSTVIAAQAALAQAGLGYEPKTWLEYQHPEYRRECDQWVFARDNYTGEVLLPAKIGRYLIQKYLGETPEAFAERMLLADYTPHFSTIVDSLVGMLFQSETDASKIWGNLGSLEDRGTPIGRLGLDADGAGHGYETLWRLLSIELTGIHRAWICVDGNVPGQPRVRILPAESVPNWRYENGVLVEALVKEDVDPRASLEEKAETETQYIRFTTAGWQRYRSVKGTDGCADRVEPVGVPGTYRYEDQNKRAALPVFMVRLSLPRPVGYILARKAATIFNMESTRDAGLRAASFALLNVVGNDTTFKKVTDMLKVGARALPNMVGPQAHHFIAPSAEPSRVLTEVLKEKVVNFWRSGFREYGESATRKTAEEVRQDVAGGVGAFLAHLKAAVDDAENQTLWRLEQTYFPGDRAKWFNAKVSRSDDFVPFDINWTIERLKERYFGTDVTVPVGRAALIEAARQIATWDGLPVNDKEIAGAVDVAQMTASLALTAGLPLPAEARAEAAMRYLTVAGYADATTMAALKPKVLAMAQKMEESAAAPAVPPGAPGTGAPNRRFGSVQRPSAGPSEPTPPRA